MKTTKTMTAQQAARIEPTKKSGGGAVGPYSSARKGTKRG